VAILLRQAIVAILEYQDTALFPDIRESVVTRLFLATQGIQVAGHLDIRGTQVCRVIQATVRPQDTAGTQAGVGIRPFRDIADIRDYLVTPVREFQDILDMVNLATQDTEGQGTPVTPD